MRFCSALLRTTYRCICADSAHWGVDSAAAISEMAQYFLIVLLSFFLPANGPSPIDVFPAARISVWLGTAPILRGACYRAGRQLQRLAHTWTERVCAADGGRRAADRHGGYRYIYPPVGYRSQHAARLV